MLYVYTGTDRDKARAEMNKALRQAQGKHSVVRITDANTLADLASALQGVGMFGEKGVVVLDGVFANDEMKAYVLDRLPDLSSQDQLTIIYDSAPDAATRKKLERHAERTERFDSPKQKGRGAEIFALAYALKSADKKRLWVEYQRALSRDEAPEAIHGVLFWGAKDMLLRAKARSSEWNRGARLVANLAELPHEARRQGFELEYALEHYILGINSSTSLTVHNEQRRIVNKA